MKNKFNVTILRFNKSAEFCAHSIHFLFRGQNTKALKTNGCVLFTEILRNVILRNHCADITEYLLVFVGFGQSNKYLRATKIGNKYIYI